MANYYSDQMDRSKANGWYVYVVSMPRFSKIGTAACVARRLAGIQNGNPYALKVEAIWHFKCRNEAMAVESTALKMIACRIPKRDWCECPPDLAIWAVTEAIAERNSAATLMEAA